MRKILLSLSIIALVVAANNLMAQDDKTSYDRSRKISDQLKNGTAPGRKFGPEFKKTEQQVSQPTAAERAGTLGSQLKKGGLQGTHIASGSGGVVNRNATNARRTARASQPLSSDQPAAKAPVPATPAANGGMKEPSQGGVPHPALKVESKTSKKTEPATPAVDDKKQ